VHHLYICERLLLLLAILHGEEAQWGGAGGVVLHSKRHRSSRLGPSTHLIQQHINQMHSNYNGRKDLIKLESHETFNQSTFPTGLVTHNNDGRRIKWFVKILEFQNYHQWQ
jgi:hypothetical protein